MPDQKPTPPQQFSGAVGLVLAILGFAASAYAINVSNSQYFIAMPICHLVGAASGYYGVHAWTGKVAVILCGVSLSLVIALLLILFALSFFFRMPVC